MQSAFDSAYARSFAHAREVSAFRTTLEVALEALSTEEEPGGSRDLSRLRRVAEEAARRCQAMDESEIREDKMKELAELTELKEEARRLLEKFGYDMKL